MQKSATQLGKDYHLTGEEMNRVLLKSGFLTGEAGDYSPTEKAMAFVEEVEHHRGTGGYAFYNRCFTTRTFDDSILDHLHLTDEMIREVRQELKEKRLLQNAESKAIRSETVETAGKQLVKQASRPASNWTADKTLTVLIITGIVAVTGYAAYQATPYIKQKIQQQKDKKRSADL